ncbi:hypothetical protein [Paenibacillus glucanolyticus]|uniref:hypothetical protein n=1 Tax=Paenibacillus glucanolyticus TaxID=59843 RepID=UPI00128C4112|nr:hypothetical protein [Paenibacillus glucanolyticus]MPY20278.1 hypothetical protein [Paenibacillus glucanolyticus]
MKTRRELLMERLSNYRTVPGHGPDISRKSDDELEDYVKLLERMFEAAFKQDDDVGSDGI